MEIHGFTLLSGNVQMEQGRTPAVLVTYRVHRGGVLLIDIDTAVEYISSTTTETGLKVICEKSQMMGKYPEMKRRSGDEEMAIGT